MEKIKSFYQIGIPLILIIAYIVYYISYKKKEANEEQVNAYINGSVEFSFDKNKIIKYTIEPYTHFFSISSYPKSKRTILIKPAASTRYFALEVYDKKQQTVDLSAVAEHVINMTINKEEYNNPVYGTIENPVPVLYYMDADSPDDVYIDQEQYRKNVKEYLTFIKKQND